MSFNKLKRVRQISATPLPSGLASPLPGKSGNITYLSVQTVIDMLNIAFGDSWSVQYSDPVEEPFSSPQNRVIRVKATLSVDTIDPQTGEKVHIVREGFGAEKLKRNGEENITKAAQSDALKKAASTFGLDAQLRRNPIEAQFFYMLYSEPPFLTWTQENMTTYAKEWERINTIAAQYSLTPAILNAYMAKFSDGKDTFISPSNIGHFVEELSKIYKPSTEGVAPLMMPEIKTEQKVG